GPERGGELVQVAFGQRLAETLLEGGGDRSPGLAGEQLLEQEVLLLPQPVRRPAGGVEDDEPFRGGGGQSRFVHGRVLQRGAIALRKHTSRPPCGSNWLCYALFTGRLTMLRALRAVLYSACTLAGGGCGSGTAGRSKRREKSDLARSVQFLDTPAGRP